MEIKEGLWGDDTETETSNMRRKQPHKGSGEECTERAAHTKLRTGAWQKKVTASRVYSTVGGFTKRTKSWGRGAGRVKSLYSRCCGKPWENVKWWSYLTKFFSFKRTTLVACSRMSWQGQKSRRGCSWGHPARKQWLYSGFVGKVEEKITDFICILEVGLTGLTDGSHEVDEDRDSDTAPTGSQVNRYAVCIVRKIWERT